MHFWICWLWMASFLFLLNDGYGRRGLVIIASSKSLSALGQTCPFLRNWDLRTLVVEVPEEGWVNEQTTSSLWDFFQVSLLGLGVSVCCNPTLFAVINGIAAKNPEFLPLLAPTKETRPYLQLVVQLEEVHRSFPLVELLGKVMIIHKFQVKNSLLFSHYYGIIGQKPISNAFYRCRNSPLLTVASISGRTYC